MKSLVIVALLGSTCSIPAFGAEGGAQDGARKYLIETSDSAPKSPPKSFVSFEQEESLAHWHALNGGTLGLSPEIAKDGATSAKWSFRRGSRLHIDEFTAFAQTTEPQRGRLKLWIYNAQAIADHLHLQIGERTELAAGQPRYRFTFNLNFHGWRTLWINRPDKFAAVPGYHGSGVPDTLEILAPDSVASGTLYFDNLEADQDGTFAISTDRQMPFIDQGENSREYRIAQFTPDQTPLPPLTIQEKQDFARIAHRVDEFLFPQGIDYRSLNDADPLRIRYESLLKTAQQKIEAYDKLGIVRKPDGRLRGPPLYGPNDYKKPKYADHEKTWTSLLADWKLNRNPESKRKILDFLEYFSEQGYADGSNAGFTGIEHLRMSGWAFTAYAMRQELAEAGRLPAEIATMKWKTLFGLVYRYDPLDLTYSYETDYIRGSMPFQLLAILMMPDSAEKARDMRCFVNFFEKVVAPKSGLRGGLKPDGIVFHHNNAYMGAYGLDALNVLAEIDFFLAGTGFAIGKETHATIRDGLIAYRNSSNGYNLHLGLYGRMPEISNPLLELLGAYAYLGLIGDQEMAESFLSLWKPEDRRTQAIFPKAINSINYFTTLGQMALIKEAAQTFQAKALVAAPVPQGCWIYPYGSYAVHRRGSWMVTCRGLSPQSMNYEYGIDGYDQNPWGKYVNYGTTLVYSEAGNVGSGIDTAHGWDWNRWPGSTAIHLPMADLKYSKHHCYGDEGFVGGVTNGGRNGVFAMKLHEPAPVESTFRANKTWFFFGNEVICLGSDIRNDDAANSTETTIFQTTSGNATSPPYYFDHTEPLSADVDDHAVATATSAWLIDPYGTGYIIPDALGLHVSRGKRESVNHLGVPSTGNVTMAWLDHGLAPAGREYEYVIVPGAAPEAMASKSQRPDYTVLQKDQAAHIVRCATLGLIGYALFAPAADLTHGALKSTSSPVIILESTGNDAHHLQLSIADPDLRMGRTPTYASRAITPAEIIPSQKQQVRGTLRGHWRPQGALPAGMTLSHLDADTVCTIDAVDGKTFEVLLEAGELSTR